MHIISSPISAGFSKFNVFFYTKGTSGISGGPKALSGWVGLRLIPYIRYHVSRPWREKTTLIGRLTSVQKSRPKWTTVVGSGSPKSTVEMRWWYIGGPDRHYKVEFIIFQIRWTVFWRIFSCFAMFLCVNWKRPILGFQRLDDPFCYRTSGHHPWKRLVMIANAQKGIWVDRGRKLESPRRKNEQTAQIGSKSHRLTEWQRQRELLLKQRISRQHRSEKQEPRARAESQSQEPEPRARAKS